MSVYRHPAAGLIPLTVAVLTPVMMARAQSTLDEYIIEGVATTIPFHQKLMEDEQFKKGVFTTAFMDTFEF